jgi:dinuclear metal center YbgI/SA1388 family protein
MLTIADVISPLEIMAPLSLQESYDNSGLLVGDKKLPCSGAILALDVTEEVVNEAISNKYNLIIAHHPVIFQGLKQLTGKNNVQRAIQSAIKHDIAIYACHTNMDNVPDGVNHYMAQKIGLINCKILAPKRQLLRKLTVFVPTAYLSKLEQSLFDAGAGHIGNYAECAFVTEGIGSFKPEQGASPYSGEIGKRNMNKEMKLEVIFPSWREFDVLQAMRQVHPYEEIAYDVIHLDNELPTMGSGMLGELPEERDEVSFFNQLNQAFGLKVVKHTPFLSKKIKKVAICGGAGGFLMKEAGQKGADIFITSDLKYHDYFECPAGMILADIGHFESEQFTIDLFHDVLRQNFPTFALLKTGVTTNPVRYFIAS